MSVGHLRNTLHYLTLCGAGWETPQEDKVSREGAAWSYRKTQTRPPISAYDKPIIGGASASALGDIPTHLGSSCPR